MYRIFKSLSITRWACRAEAVAAIKTDYLATPVALVQKLYPGLYPGAF